MNPPTNNWRKKQTEHRFYAEIGADITKRNVKTHNTIYVVSTENWAWHGPM